MSSTATEPAKNGNAQLHNGVVKSVLSGDTIVVRGRPVNGPPPEKVITLAAVNAPRLSKVDSEPWSFRAREFMRELVVGKSISFQTEHVSPSGREYVTAFVNGQNLIHLGLQAGWLKLRRDNNKNAASADEYLEELENRAKNESLGVWSSEPDPTPAASHQLDDAVEYLNKNGKNKRLDAIVEQVRDGTTLRVMFLHDHQFAVCIMAGIKAPIYRKDVPGMDDLVEPHAEESKFFTESRLLHRKVEVVISGNSNQNLIVNVFHPAGSISELLVQNGLARVVDWSIPFVSGGVEALRSAEAAAKGRRLRIWKNFEPSHVRDESFEGTVSRIVTADTVLVDTSVTEGVKLTLSSVRQPNSTTESAAHIDAKEYLRQKLIGKKVKVEVDYKQPPANGFDERVCASITIGTLNIAEAMLSKGHLYLKRHKQDDQNRSRYYDKLIMAENKAQQAKIGLYSSEPQAAVRVSDASESTAKARGFLPFFSRAGRISAVVEHVISGSKFRLYIPKDKCKLSFALAGIRCPRVGRAPTEKSEPFGKESLSFTEKKLLQRDVQVEIQNIDRAGGFIGTLWFDKTENYAVTLLRGGLAYIYGGSADSNPYSSEMYIAENDAKTESKNLWSVYQEEVASASNEPEVISNDVRDVCVTEVVSGTKCYVQFIGHETMQLENLMKEMEFSIKSRIAPAIVKPKVGDVVAAKYSVDKHWYRAKIRNVSATEYEVFFIDYGNSEKVAAEYVTTIDAGLLKLQPQAHELQLSFVMGPSLDQEYGLDAAEYFKELVNKPALKANIDMKQGPVLHGTLYDPDEVAQVNPNLAKLSVNAKLLKQGYAQVDSTRKADKNATVIEIFREQERFARMNRLGMFEYGDFDLDDSQ